MRKERIKEIKEQLEAGVKAVFESDTYKVCRKKCNGKDFNEYLMSVCQRNKSRQMNASIYGHFR